MVHRWLCPPSRRDGSRGAITQAPHRRCRRWALPRRPRLTALPPARTALAAVAAGLAWLAAPPPAQAAEVELLSATLTVGATATQAGLTTSLGSMTDTTFRYDGADYEIERLTVLTPTMGDATLRLSVDLNIPSNLRATLELTLDGTSFAGSDAAIDGNALTWTNPGLSWSDGDTVAVTLEAVERPAAPASLTATPGNGEVALSWTDPEDDTIDEWQYRVRGSDGAFGTWTDIDPSDKDTTSYTVENLTNRTAYTFEVRAVNEAGDGAAASVTATPFLDPPAAPEYLAPRRGDGWVTLRWRRSGDDTITRYEYRVSTDGGTSWRPDWRGIPSTAAATREYRIGNLTNEVEHTFEVRAVNAAGAGAATRYTATPSIESWSWRLELSEDTIYNDAESTITLSFVAVYQAAPGFTTLDVRLDGDVDGPTGGDVPGADLHAALKDSNNLLRVYQVSFNDQNPENAIEKDCTTDSSAGTVTCRDSWAPIVAQRVAPPGIWHADVFVANRFAFVAIVDEADAARQVMSGNLSKPTFTVLPAAVTELAAAVGDRAVTLTWYNASTIGVTGYQYRVSADAGRRWRPDWTPIDGSDHSTRSHRIAGLTNNTEYTFEVRPVSAAGAGKAAQVEATPEPAPPVPAAPTGLTFSFPDASGRVILSWDDPGDSDITGYQVRQRSAADGTTWNPDWPANLATLNGGTGAAVTSHEVSALTVGETYTFEVRAVSAVGAGPATRLRVALAPPAVPSLTATPGNRAVTLSWPAPGHPSITGYEFSMDGVSWAAIPDSAPGGANATSFTTERTDQGARLRNGVQYFIVVRAQSIFGPGAVAQASATPGTPAAAAIPAQTLTAGEGPATLNLGDYFTDNNGADDLTFSAASSDESVAQVSVAGAALTITPAAQGKATITITATDGGLTGLSAGRRFAVTVAPPQLSLGKAQGPGTVKAAAGAEAAALRLPLTASGQVQVSALTVQVRASGAAKLADIAAVSAYLDGNGNGRRDGGERRLGSGSLKDGRLTIRPDLTMANGDRLNLVFALQFQRQLAAAGAVVLLGSVLGFAARGRGGGGGNRAGARRARRPGRTLAAALLALGLVLAVAACKEAVPQQEPQQRSYQLTLTAVEVAEGTLVSGLPRQGISGATVTIDP